MSAVKDKFAQYSAAKIAETYTAKDLEKRKTKIVCTLGPGCSNVETLVKMIDAGLDVARLNFSHGDHAAHKKILQILCDAMKQRPNKTVGIMLDTKGPEIRTGLLSNGTTIQLEAGQTLKITTDYTFKGTNEMISCSYNKLPESVKVNSRILIADGSISVIVTDIKSDHIVTRVMNSAILGERKNMNLPGIKVDLPVCGEKELTDILEFGIPNHCVYIALSFTQCAKDVLDLKAILKKHNGEHMKIVPKIENLEGILNFDEILAVSDGIMVARGDMGMEIPAERVFIAQKMMIKKCRLAGKCVITATQMLESMINNPRATRAEISDVANAVLDGSDCVMLSGESANGLYPVLAVETLAKTSFEAENVQDWLEIFQTTISELPKPLSLKESLCSAAAHTALTTNVSIILVISESGEATRLISKYRPKQNILGLTTNKHTIQYLKSFYGVVPIHVHSIPADTNDLVNSTLQEAKKMGFLKFNEVALIVYEKDETCQIQTMNVP